MAVRCVVFAALVIFGCIPGTAADGEDSRAEIKSLLTRHCFACHDAETKEAEIDLSGVSSPDAFLQQRRTWMRVLEVLEAGQMPPEAELQPSEGERHRMIQGIRVSLDSVDWAAIRAPGRASRARLTRAEYQHSIEDLFGVAVDLDDILPDDPDGLSGFANDRASLVITANQFSRYLKAAEIAAAAIVDGSAEKSAVVRYEVEEGTNANWKKRPAKAQDGSLGWTFSAALGNKYQSVSSTFDFPRTSRYRICVRARSTGPGPTAGMWIALDSFNDASRETGVLVTSQDFKTYETERFITKGRHSIIFGYDFYGPLWLPEPPERAQAKLGQSTFDPPPYDRAAWLPDGITVADLQRHGLRAPDGQQTRVTELVSVINQGYFPAVLDHLMLNKFHYEKGYLPVFIGGLSYEYTEKVVPALSELADVLGAERATLEKIWKEREPEAFAELRKFTALQKAAWTKQDKSRKAEVGDLFVDWIEMEPIPADVQLPRSPAEMAEYLDQLLPRAWRGPVDAATRSRFLDIYGGELEAGAGHSLALQRVLIAVLISPEFLYRNDGPAIAPGVAQLDDHALAARLASFLWSSLPDAKLAEVAQQGSLNGETVLGQQVDRMLSDDRRTRFAELFTAQWLDLSGIGLEKEPDKELFRYFSWRLAEDMRTEVALLFDRIVAENRSVLELLDGQEAILNERLARLYGIESVSGAEFRPVALHDRRRGGLLGTAAVLAATSLATRTSPVRRGQFVLETLLDVELPPPPPGVPELDSEAGQSGDVSLRESLAAHRSDSKCAGCHAKIDPLGLALENFDWIGRWRVRDPAGVVDSTGTMPDGRQLNGVVELKQYLVNERADDFARALTRHLLAYALGRELAYYDEDAVRGIVQKLKADDYRAQTLVKAIVNSYPFRYREIAPQDLDLGVLPENGQEESSQ